MDRFSNEAISKMEYYVYRLVDPRNGQTFYVGKGKGNRIFAHAKCALASYENESYKEKDEDEISAKYKVIREIAADGLQVISIIQRWGLDEKTAFEVESAVIDCYAGLTNIQNGHDGDRGITNAEALNQVLSATPYNDDNDIDYLIIKTSQNRMSEVGLYEATRSCWKVDPKRLANKYVLAVVNGIVKEVYKPTSWYKVEGTNRYAFNGEVAEKEVRNVFVTHRIPEKYSAKGMANPTLYKKKD